MIEKIECTCIEAYTTRKMRDPNCCACSCDHNDLVEQLAKANERVRESNKALAEMFWYFSPDGHKYPLAEKALNKFAIEQRIEALQWVVRELPVYGVVSGDIVEKIEQLRKEQE